MTNERFFAGLGCFFFLFRSILISNSSFVDFLLGLIASIQYYQHTGILPLISIWMGHMCIKTNIEIDCYLHVSCLDKKSFDAIIFLKNTKSNSQFLIEWICSTRNVVIGFVFCWNTIREENYWHIFYLRACFIRYCCINRLVYINFQVNNVRMYLVL